MKYFVGSKLFYGDTIEGFTCDNVINECSLSLLEWFIKDCSEYFYFILMSVIPLSIDSPTSPQLLDISLHKEHNLAF